MGVRIMTITLTGDPRTKKNSQRIIRIGRGSRIIPSKAYMDYAEECALQLLAQRATNAGIDYPVNVCCVYYMPTRRKVDLTNLNEAIHDILVANYVLMDDNRDIIASTDGSRVEYDKQHPRVEITITPLEGDYEQWAKGSK
jgi:Holliday junction resolvase RusA-like endonuclease